MPIEIKELIIKALVQEDPDKTITKSSSASASQINAIVSECVEQVLKIIKEKQER